MDKKTALTNATTWEVAEGAGFLPSEILENVKQEMQQVYPDGLEDTVLDETILDEIRRRIPREGEEIAHLFRGETGQQTPAAASIAQRTTTRKRAATDEIDKLKYTPKPKKLTSSMEVKARAEQLKLRGQYMEQEASVAKLDSELKRILERKFGRELIMASKGTMKATHSGFGVQLYWYAYHTTVNRMSNEEYQMLLDKMCGTGSDKAPEDVLVRLDRFFEAFADAGRPMNELEKVRLFMKAISEQFGDETAALMRDLPRRYDMRAQNNSGRQIQMFREAILEHVYAGQSWQVGTPQGKVRALQTSPELVTMAAMQEQIDRLNALQNEKQGGGAAKKKSWASEQPGLRRAPKAEDDKAIWQDKALCAYHCTERRTGGKTKYSHTNAECKMRDPSHPTYSKDYDEAIKKFVKK